MRFTQDSEIGNTRKSRNSRCVVVRHFALTLTLCPVVKQVALTLTLLESIDFLAFHSSLIGASHYNELYLQNVVEIKEIKLYK